MYIFNRKYRRLFEKNIKNYTKTERKRYMFQYLLSNCNLHKYRSFNDFNPDLEGYMNNYVIPKSLNDLFSVSMPTYIMEEKVSFEQSVSLALFLCLNYKDILSKYISFREQYEKYLFSNQFEKAKEVLELINQNCGYSMWSCGQMLVLEEEIGGLESHKSLLANYYNIANKFPCSLLQFLSYRAESNTSINNYNEKVEKFLRGKEDLRVISYFSYKLKVQDISIDESSKYLLQVDSQLSIVDLYNSLLDILQRATIAQMDIVLNKIDTISELYSFVNDFRIRNILIYNGKLEIANLEIDSEALSSIEEYTIENYDNAYQKLKSYLVQYPNDYQMWILYIKCCIFLSQTPNITNDIISDVNSIYVLDEECLFAHNRLLGHLKKYCDTTWKYKILNTTKRKLSFDKNKDQYIALSLLGEYFVSPRFISMIPDDTIREELMKSYRESAPYSFDLLTEHMVCLKTDSNSFRRKLYDSDNYVKQEKYKESIVLLKELFNERITDSKYVREKIIHRLYFSLCCYEKYEEAIEIIVQAYFEDEKLIRRCDLNYILEKIKSGRFKSIYSDINYPIFVYISNKLDYKEQRIAFSNYLDSNEIYTKEAFYKFVIGDSPQNILFMEKICVMDVLKRHLVFVDNSTIAYSIRIELLQQLIKINPAKQNVYLEEISSITKRREIINRVRLVSEHKIKVDTEKIKEERKELFEENFQKYLQIKSFNYNLEGYDINGFNDRDFFTPEVETIKSYSQRELALKDLVTDIQYSFLRNEKYGLDNYLSSRIRHGYCHAMLTKSFRECHLLLSSSESDSKNYNVSQYWDEKAYNPYSDEYESIKKVLSDFTFLVEDKINEIRQKWIRIKTNSSEEGMFDYTEFVVTALAVDAENIEEFDVMYNKIVGALWKFTEANLIAVREKIEGELNDYFVSIMKDLEARIKKFETSSEQELCKEIVNSISLCKPQIKQSLNEFKKIFYRDDVVYEDFTLDDLAKTCIGIETQIHANFKEIKLQKNIKGDRRLKGIHFSDFVDIVVMMINNSISHAGFSDMRLLEIELNFSIGIDKEQYGYMQERYNQKSGKSGEVFPIDNFLVLSVHNNLSSGKDISQIEQRVKKILEDVEDIDKLKKLSITEGGSGIYKIYKTINYNIDAPFAIQCFVDEDGFALFLVFDAENLFSEGE